MNFMTFVNGFTLSPRSTLLTGSLAVAGLMALLSSTVLAAPLEITIVLTTFLLILPTVLLLMPRQNLEGQSLWARCMAFYNSYTHGEHVLQAIEDLDYIAGFTRKYGWVALEKHQEKLAFSHAYLARCLPFLLEAKQEMDLIHWCQIQDEQLQDGQQELISTFQSASNTFMPVASALNAVAILLAFKGGFNADLASASFLMTLGSWIISAGVMNPLIQQFERHVVEESTLRRLIVHGLRGIWKQQHPEALRQELESFLPYDARSLTRA
jgi:flagellar motor component MotA